MQGKTGNNLFENTMLIVSRVEILNVVSKGIVLVLQAMVFIESK